MEPHYKELWFNKTLITRQFCSSQLFIKFFSSLWYNEILIYEGNFYGPVILVLRKFHCIPFCCLKKQITFTHLSSFIFISEWKLNRTKLLLSPTPKIELQNPTFYGWYNSHVHPWKFWEINYQNYSTVSTFTKALDVLTQDANYSSGFCNIL